MTTPLVRMFGLGVLAAACLRAQEPQLVNYQGRVAVNGVNFKGPGQFKFAIVDADGATTYWSNDGTSVAGSEPAAAITLIVSKGGYSVLLGDATLPNMAPISASVFANADVRLRVWFDDGTHGSQLLTPDQCLTLAKPAQESADPVILGADGNGEHRDQLRGGGSTTDYWRNAEATTPGPRESHTAVWTGSEMIIWGGFTRGRIEYYNTGARYNPITNTWRPLSTNGAPAARRSHTAVWTGTEMLVWGGYTAADATSSTGDRYNPATDLWAPITISGAPQSRFNHSAVWTGHEMIIWGGIHYDGHYTEAVDGGRYDPATNHWTPVTIAGAPEARAYHTAVWSGSEMILWGGQTMDGIVFDDGGRYDPSSNTWKPVTTTGAPTARAEHSAVWTGTEMIVWGAGGFEFAGTGGRYNPATDTWTPTTRTGAPASFYRLLAVWTGSEMIIWGGYNGGSAYSEQGGRYNPATDTWKLMTTLGAPFQRSSHSAVWTGSEFIVWGGFKNTSPSRTISDGARYSPALDRWIGLAPTIRSAHLAVWTGSEMLVFGGITPDSDYPGDIGRFDLTSGTWTSVTPAGAPPGRDAHTTVWTGSELITWGGFRPGAPYSNDGSRYNPVANTWTPVTTVAAPSGRNAHTAVWTGTEMIIWGGEGTGNTGGRYNPGTNTWSATALAGRPTLRSGHTAIWTGSEMIVWGGTASYEDLTTGGRYNPLNNSWAPLTTTGAPVGRSEHTAVWTGTEMIVWGGWHRVPFPGGGMLLNGGARFNPATDTWTDLPLANAPTARGLHTAVWTGQEMIVWGGASGRDPLDTGGRYFPATNAWVATSTTQPALPRFLHTAVWTGSEMIVWGGNLGDNFGGDQTGTYLYTPTPLPFRITDAVRSGGDLVVQFTTVPNCTYTLWQSDGLTGGAWTNTGLPALPGTGGNLSFTIPATTPPSRFFRVQVGPQ